MIGYGIDYSGAKIHESTAKDGMEQPVKYWVPSIAPSGMLFYTGKLFPKWSGSLFTGALAGTMLVRLSLNGNAVDGRRTPAAESARADPRCQAGPGRRPVAADRQLHRADPAGGALRKVTARDERVNGKLRPRFKVPQFPGTQRMNRRQFVFALSGAMTLLAATRPGRAECGGLSVREFVETTYYKQARLHAAKTPPSNDDFHALFSPGMRRLMQAPRQYPKNQMIGPLLNAFFG